MAEKNQPWSSARMLEAWGLRTSGGFLKNPLKLSTGGAGSIDENWQAKAYVESVSGFALARPILAWIFIDGGQPETFHIRRPGESLAEALKRLGWQDYVMLSPAHIALEVFRDFEVELIEALAERPFVPLHEAQEEEVKPEAPHNHGSLRDLVA